MVSNYIGAEILPSDLLVAYGSYGAVRSSYLSKLDSTARLVEQTLKRHVICIEIVL
jgi:hypothetical protein